MRIRVEGKEEDKSIKRKKIIQISRLRQKMFDAEYVRNSVMVQDTRYSASV